MGELLSDRVVRWWLPDEVVIVGEVPKTSVGKLDEKVLSSSIDHIVLD